MTSQRIALLALCALSGLAAEMDRVEEKEPEKTTRKVRPRKGR